MKNKYEYLFLFEFSKIIIGVLNLLFLAETYPELSQIISFLSIFSSLVTAADVTVGSAVGLAAGVALTVAGAGLAGEAAAVGLAAGAGLAAGVAGVALTVAGVAAAENKEPLRKIKRCKTCKQELA